MQHALIFLSLLVGGELPSEEPGLQEVRSFGIQLGAALGARQVEGTAFTPRGDTLYKGEGGYSPAPGYFLVVDYALIRYVGVQTGLNWVTKGWDWFNDIDLPHYTASVRPQYLTIPLMLRLELPLEGRLGTFRMYLRGGVGADFLLVKGGTWDYSDGTEVDLAQTFYKGHRNYNFSLLLGGGFELGLFENPGLFVGLDLLTDSHLMGEFDASVPGATWRYWNVFIGLHLTYQMYEPTGRISP